MKSPFEESKAIVCRDKFQLPTKPTIASIIVSSPNISFQDKTFHFPVIIPLFCVPIDYLNTLSRRFSAWLSFLQILLLNRFCIQSILFVMKSNYVSFLCA